MRRSGSSRLLASAIAVLLVAIAVYLPTLDHEFVWDDLSILMANESLGDWSQIASQLSPGFFHEQQGEGLSDYWRPAVVLTHMVDRSLFGDSPRGPHLVNAILHSLTALSVFALAWAWTRNLRWALTAGLLFAVHPVQVETVAWVSGRSDLLLGLFLAAALWADHRYGQTGSLRWLTTALGLFTLALLSKEAAVVFPLLVALRVLWTAPHGPRPRGSGAVIVLSSLVVLAAFLWFRFGLLDAAIPAGLESPVDRTMLFWTWWRAFWRYLALLAWPAQSTPLHMVEAASGPFSPSVAAGGLAFLLLAGFGWRTRRRHPGLSFGLALFLVALAPLTNFLIPISPVGGAEFALAERYLYAPSIGFCLASAWLLAVCLPDLLVTASNRRRLHRLMAACPAVAVLVLAGAATTARIPNWASDLTLFRVAVRTSPESYLGHLNYASALAASAEGPTRRQTLETANDHFLEAARLAPENFRIHYDLGNLQHSLGQVEQAVQSYRRALQLAPDLPQARINLGALLARSGDLEGALEQFEAADRLRPELVAAKVNRGHVLQELGRTEEAILLYQEALRLEPDLMAARDGLARARETLARRSGDNP